MYVYTYMYPHTHTHMQRNMYAIMYVFVIVIFPLDGDGLNELVIGYSDRQVRMYKWLDTRDDLSSSSSTLSGQFQLMCTWHLAGQVHSHNQTFFDSRKSLLTDFKVGCLTFKLGT